MSSPNDEQRIEEPETELRRPSRTKMILVGTLIVVLSLGFFAAVYTALSKSFDSLAHKAAKSMSTGFDDEPPAAPPAPAPDPAPRVPGL